MSYKTCPICGSNLDPGEICDCMKKESASAATETPSDVGKRYSSTAILSDPFQDVNNLIRLKELLEDTGAMAKDVALVVRDTFPKFNRQLLSMAGNYGEYGVIIHPDGLRAICTEYGIALQQAPVIPIEVEKPAPKKTENRKLSRRVVFRMTTSEYEVLQKRIMDDGYDSLQSWLYSKITEMLGGPADEHS